MRIARNLCLVLAFLGALPITALAQVGGSIDGTVTDPNGAVVPAAKVTATEVQTGLIFNSVTTQAGLYAFPLLPEGPYSIRVTASGFKSLVREGIEVRVGLSETIDFKLELGTVQQTVEIKGVAPVLETNNEVRGTNMSPQTLDMLPLFFGGSVRLANGFIGYMPGVNGNGETSINGSTGRASEVMIDGGSIISPESGGTSFYFPGYEPYGEFKLVTSGFQAEDGRVGGGIQEFVTKSGTNQVHASAFFNFERQFFNAVPWATNASAASRDIPPCIAPQAVACRPKVRYNDEGGAAGGPVYIPHIYDGRNKTFFYFTYEGYWQPSSVTVNNGESTPTAAMLQGNFAGLATLYDPATNPRVPFSSEAACGGVNCIPQSRFSSISKNIIPYIPAPNVGGGNVSPIGDYTYNSLNTVTDMDWSIKVDHTIHTNHHLAFFYTRRLNPTATDQYVPGPLSNGLTTLTAPHQFRGSHDWVINPHMVLHSFWSGDFDNESWLNPLQNGFGCKLGFNLDKCGTNQDATPVISFQSDLTMTSGGGNQTNYSGAPSCSTCMTWGMDQGKVNGGGQRNWILMWGQSLSIVRSKHEFKMGWEMRRMRTLNNDWSTTNGTYLFSQNQTEDVAGDAKTGEAFASFLLGDVNQAGAAALPVFDANIRYAYNAGYFQDTWRIKPRLTLNLGVRYEVPINWHYVNGTYSSFSPTAVNPQAGNLPGAMIFMGSGPGHIGALRPYPTDFSDIGPRVGFAYQLDSKTVIRSAFGIFYEGTGNGGCGCTDGYGGGSYSQPGDGFDPTVQWDGTGATGSAGVHPPAGFRSAVQFPGVDNFGSGGPYYMGSKFGVAPRIMEWNFTVQRQYKNWLFEAAYVGNRTHGAASSEFINTVPDSDLYLANTPSALLGGAIPANTNLLSWSFNNPNQAPLLNQLGYYAPSGNGSLNPTGAGWAVPWTTGWAGGAASLAQSLRPYPQMGTVYSANSGDGWLSYDSLQVKVEHRFGDLTSEATYVRSKTLDIMAYRQIFTQCCVEQTQDAQNIPDAKTYSNSDLPNVVAFTMSYALPFGRGKKFLGSANGLVDHLAGGWTVAGVGQYRSGTLIELTNPSNNLGTYLFEPLTKVTATGAALKTNVATNSLDPNNANIRWLTTTATGTSASFNVTPVGALGTASIYQNGLRNPWFRNENLSLNKIIGIYGEGKIYLRYSINAYNLFNRTDFGGINATINSLTFGKPSGAQIGPRQISMGLRLYF